MVRYHPFGIFIFLTCLLSPFPQPLSAEDALEAGLRQAGRYGQEGKPDFAFLELRNLLRSHPEDPRVPEIEFGIAEYHFLQRNFQEANAFFLSSLSKINPDSTERFLGQVYFLKCQEQFPGGAESSQALLSELKRELSSQKFFVAFDDKRTRAWRSPLGSLYTFNEFVDRLEILQDGKPFYTITIP